MINPPPTAIGTGFGEEGLSLLYEAFGVVEGD